MRRLFFGVLIFLIFYTLFWLNFFHVFKEKPKISLVNNTSLPSTTNTQATIDQHENVLGVTNFSFPQSYTVPIIPRKQVFNLSCEFAAAAAIIYHFKNDSFFAPPNELAAEKALMAQIGTSQNPNIGIRMGVDSATDEASLYANLNQRFGGDYFYGVHAPPFIDMFVNYGLLARPIDKNSIVYSIRKAIYSGHLVMAWIRLGYGEPIDIALSYGKTKVVKGEHTVVIHGYGEEGVTVMDPGNGSHHYISYDTILNAARLFPLPFLEVNPSINEFSYDPTERIDQLTGLDRNSVRIIVQNLSSTTGAGSAMAAILKDFGYRVLSIEYIADEEQEGVSILLKKELSDYINLFKRDLSLAGYTISSFSATLSSEISPDAVVVVGE